MKTYQKVIFLLGLILVTGLLFFIKVEVSERNQLVEAEKQSREEFLISQAQRYLDTYEAQSDGIISSVSFKSNGEVTVILEGNSWSDLSEKEQEEFKNITSTDIKWALTNYGPFSGKENITVTFQK